MNTYGGLTHTPPVNAIRCDMRSDTVTQPDAAMRRAMADAEVGDDVYGEDPSIIALERRLAEMLGKEAAIFVPSGTMSNLIAMLCHCRRGDEALCGDGYHAYIDEAAGASVLGGIALFPVPVQPDGSLRAQDVTAAIKEDDIHCAITTLLCLENTVGGRAVPLTAIDASAKAARDENLSVHLDGARFFNAIEALSCTPERLARTADTVSICLSKGLGTPVGSVLLGPADLIHRARRQRKLLGGGMRQAGVLAAAGLHALDHNITRLADDRARAASLAADLTALGAGEIRHDTNMVFLTPKDPKGLTAAMAQAGVIIGGQSPTIRMVIHKDVDDDALAAARDGFRAYFGG